MSDRPKPSDERNGCFLDKSWCCKVCDGEIPDGHLDHCDIWQLEKKHSDFIANDYNAVLIARDAIAADLARVEAERDRAREVRDEWCAEYVKARDLLQRAHRWVIGRDDVLDDAIRAAALAGSALDRGGEP